MDVGCALPQTIRHSLAAHSGAGTRAVAAGGGLAGSGDLAAVQEERLDAGMHRGAGRKGIQLGVKATLFR